MSLLTRVRHRFSVDDYEQMGSYGILTENDRVELIRGEIIEKMTLGDAHASCVKKLNRLFNSLAQGRALVSIQDPIRFPDSVPEPDVALLSPREDFYESSTPVAANVLLLIEVSDTTLERITRDQVAELGSCGSDSRVSDLRTGGAAGQASRLVPRDRSSNRIRGTVEQAAPS